MELASLPVRQERGRVAPVVFGLIAAVVAVWVVVSVVTDRSPEETVEDFLEAVADRDVEGALALVSEYGYGVPYGDDAKFLTPEAISDGWWVVSVDEVGGSSSTNAKVRAVLAGPGGTAEGTFELYEQDDEWLVSDPFVQVRFPASPLGYVRVNDKVVERPDSGVVEPSYDLFPGLYSFYRSVPGVIDTKGTTPVLAFPSESSNLDGPSVVPPALKPGKDTRTKLAESVKQRIDACADFATPAPYGGCPFATDGEIDTPDGRRVSNLHGLKWTVEKYPKVSLTDDRSENHPAGFALNTDEPGAVTLTGTGEDTEDNQTTFTVTCDIDLTGIYGVVAPDGRVTLTVTKYDPNRGNTNTCRRHP